MQRSINLISRTAARSAAAAASRGTAPSSSSSLGLLASSSSRRRLPSTSTQAAASIRHYSESGSGAANVSESEGAEAASSAKQQQQQQQQQQSSSDASSSKSGSSSSEADALRKELEAKKKEIAELKDNWLRSRAELDNFQKRTEREKASTKDFAIQSFAKEMIDGLDILHMALRSVPQDKRVHPPAASAEAENNANKEDAGHLADLFVGVEMTAHNFEKTFSRFGVEAFDPTGQKFDPNRHEALYQAPVPGKEAGTVLECQKKGWMLKDRVLRAAQVGVVADTSGNTSS